MYEWNWSNTNHNMYDGSVQITLKLWVLKSCKFYTKEIQSLLLSFVQHHFISILRLGKMVDIGYCSRYVPNGAQCRQWHQGLLPNSGASQRHGRILWQPAPRAGGGDAQG